MILLVPAYPHPDHARRGEIALCLHANLAHPQIERVLVFGDSPEVASHPKLTRVPGTDRPTFAALFRRAAIFTGEVVIIANADIYFDHTLSLAASIGDDDFYALSRWNPVTGRISGSSVAQDGTVCIPLSIGADAWIFRAPLTLRMCSADFPQGRPFCDHHLAYIATAAGLRATNPCHSIRAWHAHATRLRTYTAADSIPGDYAWLPPTALPLHPPCVASA